jgi:FtsP/CotA-like multicopper oxidase with cupredoxin domain
MAMPMPGGTPDYFVVANWAFSPPLRKFVDSLPGLGVANRNNLNQYIPVAVPDANTYPGSDYYEIELGEYTEKMHSDLNSTTLRGYRQTNTTDPNVSQFHYLGPLIIAHKDRPVRIKFTNMLPTGAGGDLFIPVDTTVMGAGMGPLGMDVTPGNQMDYTQNRGTLHLHGGRTPWISDGTPHQWITPAGENTDYPKGVSVQNVPDMPDPGDGSMTFFYSNQQSARLMFYHDHVYGITRLNVYAGEAAGYLITDQTEQELVTSGLIPAEQIPLIIQDRTFVDANTTLVTDPTWNWGSMPGMAMTGDLWFPHVYMPNQNPYDMGGANPFGRWDYGPWFWPPWPVTYGEVNNPYYDPVNAPWEPPMVPGVPNVSMTMEAFHDTPLVNGTAYPYIEVQPKTYRFRILNAANDRFWNLLLLQADPAVSVGTAGLTEVKMVPFYPGTWPAGWGTPDAREGGVPDPCMLGPDIIQIGTEGGFLPAPVVWSNIPVDYEYDRRNIVVLNVKEHNLFLGCAERADVIIDFSAFAGKTLILYNDSPAPVPAADPRLDYYTGNPDFTGTGGTTTTLPGYGPNIRTIMQIRVANTTPAPAFNLTALEDAFKSTATSQGVFARGQDPILVPQAGYDSAYNATFPAGITAYERIQSLSLTFNPLDLSQPNKLSTTPLTIMNKPKAIAEEFENEYGRMSGFLGVEVPFTNGMNQTTIFYDYIDPATETVNDSMTAMSPVAGDGTQIWKITHNGVDTHPVHFHLFDVQLINRVGWDGAIRPPELNELGWKETVRMNPLEDCIVALRPVAPKTPFTVPDSVRPLNPTMPLGDTMGFKNVDPNGNPITVTNVMTNFGWEYMWHCHILSHEEMTMMRPVVFQVGSASTYVIPGPPTNVIAAASNAQAMVSFNAPAPNGGSPITLYTVTSSPGGITATGTSSPITVTGLTNGTAYTFTVAATNAAGIGLSSNPSNSVTPAAMVPGAPTNVIATAGNAQATVSFTAPASDGGSPITGYTVTSFPAGGVDANAGTTATTHTITGLTNGTAYTFTVTATNAVGTGLASSPSNSVTPATVPGAPTLVTAVAGNAQATVSFTAPASDGGSLITGYTVTSLPAGGVDANAGTTATTHTITGLTNGTAYTFTVTATNAVGTGPASGPSNSVIPATVPGAPTNVIATAGNAQATVSFPAPASDGGSPITGYTVTSLPAGGVDANAGTTATTHTITGLTNGTAYTFTVTATNAVGTGPASSPSNSVTPAAPTLPAAPTNLTATAAGSPNPTVTLGWQDNATNETGFTIQRATNPGFSQGLTPFTVGPNPAGGATGFTDTTVAANTKYYYRVRADNVVGASAWSNAVNLTTPAPIPTAPTTLAFVSSTKNSITISWMDNATNEQGFYVERSNAIAGPWKRVATVGAKTGTGTVTYTDKGLKGKTTYWYQVQAYNAAVVSAYTNTVSGTTK